MTRTPIPFQRVLERLLDPFGFRQALDGLTLQPGDLPSLSREARLEGRGC